MHFSLICALLCAGLCKAFVLPNLGPSHHRGRTDTNHHHFPGSSLCMGTDTENPSPNSIRSNITLQNDVTLEFELHTSIASIPTETWNACLPTPEIGLGSAFLDYSWLSCLEESKCASPQTGWVPQHVSIKIAGETKGFIPLYIKGHSSKSPITHTTTLSRTPSYFF